MKFFHGTKLLNGVLGRISTMRKLFRFGLLVAISTAVPAYAQSGPLPVDAPIPADLKDRVYLPSAAVAGVRDKMDRVVGYWAYMGANGKIEVTTLRPASMLTGNGALTKVTLGSGKPSYDGILTRSTELVMSLPVLGLTWNSNQRGQLTITDTAQFAAQSDPTSADWEALPPISNGGRWVFIDSATVSVVQTSILTERGGTLSALLQAFNIGGKNYQALSGTSTSLIVSLFVKQNPKDLAASGPLKINKPTSLTVTTKPLSALSSQ